MQEIDFGPVRFLPGLDRGKYPNCHSLYIAGDGILIDPGADRQRLMRLRDQEEVKEVWLTHWHEDHFLNLDLFDDLPLRIHPADAAPLGSMDAFLDAYGIEPPDFRRDFARIVETRFHFRSRMPRADLTGGMVIPLEQVTVDVFHTPGHTPGHVCFFFRQPGVLFLGDYDLTSFGPWYGDPGSSIAQTVTSIERLQWMAARVWIAAHGTGVFTEPPGELWDDYLAVIGQREGKLARFLSEPRRLEEIVDQWIVYGKAREPIDFFRFAETAIIKKHLERMLQAHIVREEDGRYRFLG